MRLGRIIYKDIISSAELFDQKVCDDQDLVWSYYQPDKKLGWEIKPYGHHVSQNYHANSLGLRLTSNSNKKYFINSKKILVVGDSMVHGDEVKDSDSWLWKLQQICGSNFQILNGGVSGYGTDQAILRFEKLYKKIKPDIGILGITTTDLFRNFNVCRNFIATGGDFPYPKPRFIIKGNDLKLIEPPNIDVNNISKSLNTKIVRNHFFKYDRFFPHLWTQLYQVGLRIGLLSKPFHYNFFDEAISLVILIIQRFIKFCQSRSIKPIIILLPTYWGSFPSGDEMDKIYNKFKFLKVIDGRDAFSKDRLNLSSNILRCPRSHYTSESGKWIARLTANILKKI